MLQKRPKLFPYFKKKKKIVTQFIKKGKIDYWFVDPHSNYE